MQTSVEIFDEWLAAFDIPARRFHPIPDAISEPFQDQLKASSRALHLLRLLFIPGKNIDIYFDFIDDGTCNAAAGIHKYLGLVGINKGAIMLPLEMFYRMFSHPMVLEKIGRSKDERVGPQHREGISTNYDVLVEDRKKAGRSPIPRSPIDPIRLATAQLCIDLTWRFVAVHEIVHIAHGHVEYLYKTHSLRFILEVMQANSSAYSSRYNLDFQALEFWADAKAVVVSLRNFLQSESSGMSLLCPLPKQKLYLWTFTIYSLFRLWGLEINPEDLESPQHPPTAMRFHNAMSAASYDQKLWMTTRQ